MAELGVGIIGCGLIGRRRADAAAAHSRTRGTIVADAVLAEAEKVGAAHAARAVAYWRDGVAAIHLAEAPPPK